MPELRAPAPEPLVNTSLSHTAASTFMACNRKYLFSYEWGLQRKITTPGRRRGKAFASALEHWDIGPIHAEYAPIIGGVTSQSMADDLAKERDTVIILADGYMRRWRRPDLTEVPFTSPVPHPHGLATEFWNRGFIDAVEMQHGAHIPVECKLMSMWTLAQEQALQLDAQCSRYLGACRTILGWNSPHLLYRVTKWPGIRQKQQESVNEYLDRLRDEVNADVDNHANKYFLEFKVFRTDNQIQDHLESLSQLAVIIKGQVEKRFFPLNAGPACSMYGGCDFIPLCTDQPDAHEMFEQKKNDRKASQ